jgi:hypothetical protein
VCWWLYVAGRDCHSVTGNSVTHLFVREWIIPSGCVGSLIPSPSLQVMPWSLFVILQVVLMRALPQLSEQMNSQIGRELWMVFRLSSFRFGLYPSEVCRLSSDNASILLSHSRFPVRYNHWRTIMFVHGNLIYVSEFSTITTSAPTVKRAQELPHLRQEFQIFNHVFPCRMRLTFR